jgi:hypothetical protein
VKGGTAPAGSDEKDNVASAKLRSGNPCDPNLAELERESPYRAPETADRPLHVRGPGTLA